MKIEEIKPIPEPTYPCECCGCSNAWPPENLSWSEQMYVWVCDYCWERHDLTQDKRITLADEIKAQKGEL